MRIDLAVDEVTYPFDQACVRGWSRAAQRRRLDRQLTTGGIALEINAGTVQRGHAVGMHVDRETFALDFPLAAGQLVRLAEFQLAITLRRSRTDRANADTEAGNVLRSNQVAEMAGRRLTQFDHC